MIIANDEARVFGVDLGGDFPMVIARGDGLEVLGQANFFAAGKTSGWFRITDGAFWSPNASGKIELQANVKQPLLKCPRNISDHPRLKTLGVGFEQDIPGGQVWIEGYWADFADAPQHTLTKFDGQSGEWSGTEVSSSIGFSTPGLAIKNAVSEQDYLDPIPVAVYGGWFLVEDMFGETIAAAGLKVARVKKLWSRN